MSAAPWDRRYALLIGLTGTAGTLDALSFLYLGKVFSSFHSGNVLFLGLGAGSGNGGLVVRAAAALLAFVAGAALGAHLIGVRARPGAARAELSIFAVEGALLAVFATLWLTLGTPADHPVGEVVLLVVAAAAMGVQVALALAFKIPNVLTVALTATLAYLGQRLGDPQGERDLEIPSNGLLVGVSLTYAACATVIAVLPETPGLALLPLALLGTGMAIDLRANEPAVVR